MKPFGSVEAVIAAVREDAKAEIERIERDLDASMARLREEDRQRPVVVIDADARIAAARRQAAERLADEDWADRRAALADRERWIQDVVREGERRLAALEGICRRAELVRLAREALDRIGGVEVDVAISPADVPLADAAWCEEVIAGSGKRIRRVTGVDAIAHGCVAGSADSRVRYDNTYAARARRSESAWRGALGDLFERAAPGSAEPSKVPV